MDTQTINKYNIIRKFLALLIGPYGQVILEKHPEFKTYADEAYSLIKDIALKQQIDINTDSKTIFDSLNDLRELKKLVPETSYETQKEIKDKETALVMQLQSMLDYNPILYYEIYFLTVGQTQKYANETQSVIDTPKVEKFKWWFGTSKVVDAEGKPLIVYHGTGGVEQEFTKFNFKIFPGIYFAENKSYSDWFARMKQQGATVFQCYLRILNPIDLTVFKTDEVKYEDFVAYIQLRYGYTLPENTMLKKMSDEMGGMWAWRYLRAGATWLNYIKKQKEFDGLTFYENNPSDIVDGKENVTKAWMVFESNQIKAANGNSIYSLQSEDIRFEKGGKV